MEDNLIEAVEDSRWIETQAVLELLKYYLDNPVLFLEMLKSDSSSYSKFHPTSRSYAKCPIACYLKSSTWQLIEPGEIAVGTGVARYRGEFIGLPKWAQEFISLIDSNGRGEGLNGCGEEISVLKAIAALRWVGVEDE